MYGFVIIEDVFLFYNEAVNVRNVKKISILKSAWVILNNKKHALLFICSRKFSLFISIFRKKEFPVFMFNFISCSYILIMMKTDFIVLTFKKDEV